MEKEWLNLNIEEIENKLNTDIEAGLSRKEAKERLKAERENDEARDTSYFVRKKRPAYDCFLAVVKMLPAALLIFVAVAAFFMGRSQLAITVITTFISGSIISGMLYLTSQRENEALELYSNPTSRVIRDKKQYVTDSRNVVSGDIIELRAGDYIPCDSRIISCDNLLIEEACGKDGKISRKLINKTADDFLLAGSFVSEGRARAVCVKSGSNTENFELLGEGKLGAKNTDPKIMKEAHTILFKAVTYSSIIALIFATVGIFVSKEAGILEIFLMFLSFMLSITLISSPIAGRILCASMLRKAARSKNGADFAIIKNNTALDSLPKLTDIVLLGRAPLSDGKMHYSSLLCSAEVTNEPNGIKNQQKLFECVYAYLLAERNHYASQAQVRERVFEGGIENMLNTFGFDRREADLKFKSLYYIYNDESSLGYACVETPVGNYRACVTENTQIYEGCKKFRLDGNIEDITEGDRMLCENYIRDAQSIGEKILVVISEYDGESVLEGMISFCEREAEEYREISSIFSKKGIRITLMLDCESEYNVNRVSVLGIDDSEIALASKENMDIANLKKRVYMGYEISLYADAVAKMKENGRVVATCAIEDKYLPVCNNANLSISYDNMNYSSKKLSEAVLPDMILDGHPDGVRCSQKMRAYSSVIVGRTSHIGGGLRGVLNAMKTAEFFTYCYLQMMQGLACFEVAMIMLTLFSFISGIMLISYPVILLLSVAFTFFSVAAYSSFKPRLLMDGKRYGLDEFSESVSQKVCPPIVASAVYFAAAIIIRRNEHAFGISAIPLVTLLVVLVTCVWRFFGSMKKCLGKSIDMSDIKNLAEKQKNSSRIINMAAITLVITSIVRMLITAFIFPGLTHEYGFEGISIGTPILFAVYIGAFLLCEITIRILFGHKKKKVK